MTVNRSRSQNTELQEGSTDGSWKKNPPDTSVVSSAQTPLRDKMSWRFGFEDANVKYLPDGRVARRAYDDHG